MAVPYDDLPDWEQELIDDARVIIGDVDPDAPDRFFSDDGWSLLLGSAVRDFNRARPYTDFTADNFPEGLADILELGLIYKASASRYNQLLEEPDVRGYQGPYVNRRSLLDGWRARMNELQPEWKKERNRAKLLFLPGPAGTVDSWGFYGRAASMVPLLRSLPSWDYAR